VTTPLPHNSIRRDTAPLVIADGKTSRTARSVHPSHFSVAQQAGYPNRATSLPYREPRTQGNLQKCKAPAERRRDVVEAVRLAAIRQMWPGCSSGRFW
jgi:hypothetical protein